MHFTMTHEFQCTPEELWDIFVNDKEFDEKLEELTQVRRHTLQNTKEGDVEVSMIKCTSKKEMPTPMKKALGMESFEFDQESRLNRTINELHWKVIPAFLTDRVKAAGITKVTPKGDGCMRTIEGEIIINIPLVGKKMEKFLAQNVQESYEKAAIIASELLAVRK